MGNAIEITNLKKSFAVKSKGKSNIVKAVNGTSLGNQIKFWSFFIPCPDVSF